MAERGPYAKGVARKEEILRTAFEVLSRDGYRKTSLRAIGRELGLQPAHLLHYFSSREDLLEQLIIRWDQQCEDRFQRSDRGFIEAWLEIVRHNAEIPGIVHLYTAFAAEATDDNHPSRQFFVQRFGRVQQAIAGDLRARQEAGLIRDDIDPDAAARQFVALSDGLQLQWMVDPRVDMAAELERAIDVLAPRGALSTR